MVAPIDYSLNVQDPFQSAVQGIQLGSTIAQANAAEQQRAFEMQGRQEELRRQAEIRSRISELAENKNATAQDYVNIAMMLPEKEAASVRANWDTLSKEKQQSTVRSMGEALSAFKAGKPAIGLDLVRRQAEAFRNSGQEDQARQVEALAEAYEQDPGFATTHLGLTLAAVPGGKEALEGIDKFLGIKRTEEKFPLELSEAQSKAQKAAVEAKFAESNAAIDIQKKGWDIRKVQEDIDIAKENARIAALNAQINREGNEIKKQDLSLKLQEMQQKRDDAVRDKTATVESAWTNIDNLLTTADRILKTPAGVVSSATGPIGSRLPTVSDDVADFEALIENLDAQAFLAQVPQMKGMGALSENEGKKLSAALQNFNLKQSPERLFANVREAQRLMLKARQTLSTRYGIPESVPDTPEAVGAAAGGKSTDEILRELGVM